jgi:hypothetical protein
MRLELEQRRVIAERDERMRQWAWRFPENVAAMEAFYAEKEEAKAAKKTDREERRGEAGGEEEGEGREEEGGEEEWRRPVDDHRRLFLLLLRVDIDSGVVNNTELLRLRLGFRVV